MGSGKRKVIADLAKSIDELDRVRSTEPGDAPTQMVRDIYRSRRKPLIELRSDEIGQLVAQLDGLPWILDLVFPKLRSNPLFEGGYYPGDVLSNLLRADDIIWKDRPEYRDELPSLYWRALDRPFEEADSFIDSLASLTPDRMRELALSPPSSN